MIAGKSLMTTELDFIIPIIIHMVFGEKKTATGIVIIVRGFFKIHREMKKMNGGIGLIIRHRRKTERGKDIFASGFLLGGHK